MQPTLGWTLLSREALRRAEKHTEPDTQGVRDEIGFLALHQAYADRFFPGTSVLQTRLRYILFVPWLYNSIAQEKPNRSIWTVLQQKELELARRLKDSHEDGVIGGRSYPKPTSQPPSMVYWNALVSWGILRPAIDGTYPTRSVINYALSRRRSISNLLDDDKQPLEESQTFFVTLPPSPDEWNNSKVPLDFRLRTSEGQFIRQHLMGVKRSGPIPVPSLLARLVETRAAIAGIEYPWLQNVLKVAEGDDRDALLHAQQVAALAAIGRGIYAALVEQVCATEDKRSLPTYHRSYLNQVINDFRLEAMKLEVNAVTNDILGLPLGILEVLRETQRWLKHGGHFMELRPLYEKIEISRKGRRARLSQTVAGRARRAEWNPEEHPWAGPLSYRWRNVQRLLEDLRRAL
jgi:hypothetical protein